MKQLELFEQLPTAMKELKVIGEKKYQFGKCRSCSITTSLLWHWVLKDRYFFACSTTCAIQIAEELKACSQWTHGFDFDS